MQIKKLYLDIETSPNIVYSWRTGYKLNISHENIVKEREIICIAWKWAHENEVQAQEWDYRNKSRDKKLLKDFSKIYSQADEVVAQNGKNFDIKWLRTRILINDLAPLPPVKIYDTLTHNRSNFNFNSNKLDYISKVLGGKGKETMHFQDWIDVMNGNQKKLDKMVSYCMDDVLELEHIEQKTRKHVPGKVSKMILDRYDGKCGLCSGRLIKQGSFHTEVGKYQKYKCLDIKCRKIWIDNRQLKDE